MDFQSLPKVELHLHLDCSLSYQVVSKLRPEITLEVYKDAFVAPSKCTDLKDYLTRAQKGIELMQTRKELEMVTLDLFRQLEADHIRYAEIRFAPLEHLRKGLSPEEVVQTTCEAFEAGIRQTGIEAGLILCTLRHYSEAQSMQTAQLVEQFKTSRVVGLDIAGDEAGFPIEAHIAAFKYAHQAGIHCTAHAGEAMGPESVLETLDNLRPSRIGHGVRSAEDPELLDQLRDARIHLEVCPTSNVQTNVVPDIQAHPADVIFRHGVSMSVNTDARTISPVTLSSEYQLLHEVFGWTIAQFRTCNLEAIRHAFCEEAIKERLRKEILEAYQ